MCIHNTHIRSVFQVACRVYASSFLAVLKLASCKRGMSTRTFKTVFTSANDIERTILFGGRKTVCAMTTAVATLIFIIWHLNKMCITCTRAPTKLNFENLINLIEAKTHSRYASHIGLYVITFHSLFTIFKRLCFSCSAIKCKHIKSSECI